MFNIENQNHGIPTGASLLRSPSPLPLVNADFENVLTGLREQKDRNLPEASRGELGQMEKAQLMSPVATGPRKTGVVKWFNPTKGFGFITPDDGGLDVFVHQSEIQLPGFRSLAQGEPVEYQLYDGQKGPKALKVTGPQGNQVQGAPRQTKSKPEKPTLAEKSQMQSNLIKLANGYYQVANHVPVSTPVMAPTQALHSLPSMMSSPTPGSQHNYHYILAQPGFQNYYATASDLRSFDMTGLPMSPTPMMMENMPLSPMSPQPHYIPVNSVGQYTATTIPYTFPNQNRQNAMQMSLMNSPPQPSYDYSQLAGFQVVTPDSNPYDATPNSFLEEAGQMQISSPLSPIHC